MQKNKVRSTFNMQVSKKYNTIKQIQITELINSCACATLNLLTKSLKKIKHTNNIENHGLFFIHPSILINSNSLNLLKQKKPFSVTVLPEPNA